MVMNTEFEHSISIHCDVCEKPYVVYYNGDLKNLTCPDCRKKRKLNDKQEPVEQDQEKA